MENASKALLIAGAILLVIAIIAIAVGIVSSTRGTVDTAENQVDTMEVQIHNKQFSTYEGRVTGTEVKECISKVLSYNTTTKNNAMKVFVSIRNKEEAVIDGYGENYTNGVRTALGLYSMNSKEFNSGDIYIGSLVHNSQGIIIQVTFTESE